MSFPPYNQSDRNMVEVTLIIIILQNVARVGGNTRTHFFAQNNVLKAVFIAFYNFIHNSILIQKHMGVNRGQGTNASSLEFKNDDVICCSL